MSIDERDYMYEPKGKRKDSPYYEPKEFRVPTRAPGEELFDWQATRPKPPRGAWTYWPVAAVMCCIAFFAVFRIEIVDDGNLNVVERFLKRLLASDMRAEYNRQQSEADLSKKREENLRRMMAGQPSQPTTEPSRTRATESSVDPCGGQLPGNSGFWKHNDGAEPVQKKWFRFTNMLAAPLFLDIKRASDDGRMATAFVLPGESTVLTTGVHKIGVTISRGSTWCNGLVGWRDGRQLQIG